MLSIWVAAEELEPEFTRIEPKLMEVDSAFVALHQEISRLVAHYRRPDCKEAFDTAHLEVMMDQCRQQVERLRKRGTGAGAGVTAAIPAVGFVTGAAAVGVESLAFLDAATSYAVASAYLRGVDISNPERRKSIVLLSVVGSEGTPLATATMGTDSTIALLTRASTPKLSDLNKKMFNFAMKRISKSIRLAWLGKLMPLGIGAVLGSVANRKIGNNLIDHVAETLGPLPTSF